MANVLFLFTDQQARLAMGAAGNADLRTPHMDALAARGTRFDRAYCTSPVCAPSRSSLATGRMPHETGVLNNELSRSPEHPTMGEIFANAGYDSAWAGVWGIREHEGKYVPPGCTYLNGFKSAANTHMGDDIDVPIADDAIAFLERDRDRPFFLGVSLLNPHDICWHVRKMADAYPKAERFPNLPENFAIDPAEPAFIQRCRQRSHYGEENTYTQGWAEPQWRAYLDIYYRLTEQVDVQVGRILQALRDAGLEDDTIILYSADHGEGMAAHQWIVKLMLYENPVSVPFIVSWPGHIPEGEVDHRLVSGIDVLPTLCDYAGVELPEKVTGKSLKPLLEDPTFPGAEYVVSQLYPDPKDLAHCARMVRSTRYKYVTFNQPSGEMLFDLEADPGEAHNLINDGVSDEVVATHRGYLEAWCARTGDPFTRE